MKNGPERPEIPFWPKLINNRVGSLMLAAGGGGGGGSWSCISHLLTGGYITS